MRASLGLPFSAGRTRRRGQTRSLPPGPMNYIAPWELAPRLCHAAAATPVSPQRLASRAAGLGWVTCGWRRLSWCVRLRCIRFGSEQTHWIVQLLCTGRVRRVWPQTRRVEQKHSRSGGLVARSGVKIARLIWRREIGRFRPMAARSCLGPV